MFYIDILGLFYYYRLYDILYLPFYNSFVLFVICVILEGPLVD